MARPLVDQLFQLFTQPPAQQQPQQQQPQPQPQQQPQPQGGMGERSHFQRERSHPQSLGAMGERSHPQSLGAMGERSHPQSLGAMRERSHPQSLGAMGERSHPQQQQQTTENDIREYHQIQNMDEYMIIDRFYYPTSWLPLDYNPWNPAQHHYMPLQQQYYPMQWQHNNMASPYQSHQQRWHHENNDMRNERVNRRQYMNTHATPLPSHGDTTAPLINENVQQHAAPQTTMHNNERINAAAAAAAATPVETIARLLFVGGFDLGDMMRDGTTATATRAAESNALSIKVLNATTTLYITDDSVTDTTAACTICRMEFESHNIVRRITYCNHVFHSECIDRWFSDHVTCPICRNNLNSNYSETTRREPAAPAPAVPTVTPAQVQANTLTELHYHANPPTRTPITHVTLNELRTTVGRERMNIEEFDDSASDDDYV